MYDKICRSKPISHEHVHLLVEKGGSSAQYLSTIFECIAAEEYLTLFSL